MTTIDWARMAEPQIDGYDTGVILELATSGPSPLRSAPYRRRSVGDAPSIFGGRVAIRNRVSGGLPPPRYQPAAPDHPHVAKAASILALWPEAAEQFARLVDTVEVWSDVSIQPHVWLEAPGSSSHSLEPEFGAIMTTVDSPIAMAQAMAHEMAHHKLRAMGVSLMQAWRIVTNDPSELYVSPIITNRRRPMTAVLHAQYSFIHVTALDLAIVKNPGNLLDQALYLLARNVPRMELGYGEIARHLNSDAEGEPFVAAFQAWSRAVLDEGRRVLDAHGLGMPAI
jgi:HEXXH motif-containing protein